MKKIAKERARSRIPPPIAMPMIAPVASPAAGVLVDDDDAAVPAAVLLEPDTAVAVPVPPGVDAVDVAPRSSKPVTVCVRVWVTTILPTVDVTTVLRVEVTTVARVWMEYDAPVGLPAAHVASDLPPQAKLGLAGSLEQAST